MKIYEICEYAPKSSIKAGEAVDNAPYMFFTSSIDESKRYTDYQIDKEAIIMGTGGNATLHYYHGKFATSTDCIVILPNDSIRCKYLYYFFKILFLLQLSLLYHSHSFYLELIHFQVYTSIFHYLIFVSLHQQHIYSQLKNLLFLLIMHSQMI